CQVNVLEVMASVEAVRKSSSARSIRWPAYRQAAEHLARDPSDDVNQAVSIGITSYSFNPLSILQPTSGNFMYYSHILEGFVAASALYIIVTIKERTLAACQNVHSHHRVQTLLILLES
ncbi:hypothetical protein TYRP_020528, partial [Tyrophagus putrescentiae]